MGALEKSLLEDGGGGHSARPISGGCGTRRCTDLGATMDCTSCALRTPRQLGEMHGPIRYAHLIVDVIIRPTHPEM